MTELQFQSPAAWIGPAGLTLALPAGGLWGPWLTQGSTPSLCLFPQEGFLSPPVPSLCLTPKGGPGLSPQPMPLLLPQ